MAKILEFALEGLWRLALVGLGGWLAYTEAVGTFEFYLLEQGTLNYVVRAAVGITLASALLPYALSRAIKRLQLLRATSIAVAFLLSVTVVFTAAVHRTGSVADTAQADLRQAQRKLEAVKANVQTAEQALAGDKRLVEGECKTGVGKECKRLAAAGKDNLQQTINLRTQLADVKEPVEDGTAGRLSALSGGFVTETQVRTFQPLLIPISVSFIAGLLISLGLDREAPKSQERKPWRWPWPRRRMQELDPLPPASDADHMIDITPPEPERSRAIARPRQSIGTALDFLNEGVSHVAGARSCMAELYVAYQAWCEGTGARPMTIPRFFAEISKVCRRFQIEIEDDGARQFLINVRLPAGSQISGQQPSQVTS